MKMHILRLVSNCFVLGAVLLIYGIFCEPNTVKISHYTLTTPDLAGIKIAFVADFHVSKRHPNRLYKVITLINQEKPDLILLGGDYIKGHRKSSSMPIEDITRALKELKSSSGVYAVLGNHDSYYGKNDVLNAFKQVQIPVLDNANISLNIKGHELSLVGVADYYTDKPDIFKAFNNTHKPAILLSHSPDIFESTPKNVLTLAAHTHGGQIRLPVIGPLYVPADNGRKYAVGLIKDDQKQMIVTQGLGMSLLPIRINCPPEIVIITFR